MWNRWGVCTRGPGMGGYRSLKVASRTNFFCNTRIGFSILLLAEPQIVIP